MDLYDIYYYYTDTCQYMLEIMRNTKMFRG